MAILLRLRLLQILILIDSLRLYHDARAVIIKLHGHGRLYHACAVSQNSNLSGHFAENVTMKFQGLSGKDTEALATMGILDYLVSFTVI